MKKINFIALKIYHFFTKTRLRKILSSILIVLILLTSIKFLFFKPAEALASTMYWAFNEGYGSTTNDTSGNDNSGTITNAVWRTDDLCRMDKCLYFDGSGDFVTRADDADLDFVAADDFTIVGWFRHPEISTNPDYLVAKHEATVAGGYKVYMDSDGDLVFGIDDDGTWDTTDIIGDDQSRNFDDNRWHHFAAVKDGTTAIYLYVDGNLVDSDSSLVETGTLANAAAFYIGIDADGSSNGWAGFIDEIKVHRELRTQSQIYADFIEGAPEEGASASFGSQDRSYLSDGLVGYWKMDETSGNAADSSGVGSTLTNNGTATFSAAKYGNGAELDGSTQFFDAADNATLSITGSLTLSAWIIPDTVTGSHAILGKFDQSNESYLLSQEADEIRLYIDSSSNYETTNAANLAVDTTYHVAAVYDASSQTVKLYLNGILQASTTTGTIPSSIGDDAGEFAIGAEDTGGTAANYFDGHIDDTRVYNRALSPAEVSSLYYWGPGPVAYYPLDENTGTTSVTDHTGRGNTATMTGSMTQDDWVNGQYGPALDFDGTDDALTVATADDADFDFNGTEQFSIGAWVYIKTIPGSGEQDAIIAKWDATNALRAYRLFVTNDDADATGNFRAEVYDESADQTISAFDSNDTVNEDTWYYVSFTFNGGTAGAANDLRLYANGVFLDGNSENTLFLGLEDVASDFTIGDYDTNDAVSTNTAFTGIIDDVRVYNYVRSFRNTIEDLNADHPATALPYGPSAYYKFDEAIGIESKDSIDLDSCNMSLSGTAPFLTADGRYGGTFDGNGANRAETSGCSTFNKLDFLEGLVDFSFTLWIRSDSATNPSTDEYTFAKAATTSRGYALWVNISGQAVFGIDDDTTFAPEDTVTTTTDVYDATWHHIAVVKNGTSSMQIYVDGTLEATDSSLVETGGLFNSDSFNVGDFDTNGTNDNEFFGDVDELKLFRFALTQAEINAEFANQGKSATLGSLGTDSSGEVDNSRSRTYCIPGDTTSCSVPTGHWSMDENDGQFAFNLSSADVPEGRLGSTTSVEASDPAWAPGIIGQALSFDGSDDSLSIADDDEEDFDAGVDFTIEAWVNRSSFTTDDAIINKGGSIAINRSHYHIFIDDSTDLVTVSLGDGGGAASDLYTLPGTTAITSSGWHHVALVVDRDSEANTRLYLDGVDDKGTPTNSITDLAGTIGVVPAVLWVGRRDGGTPEYFHGAIDDVRLYRYARTPAQIAWDYNYGKPMGWWRMDDNVSGDAQTIRDASGIGNDGTTSNNSTNLDCTVAGKRNLACDLDGTDDYVTMGDFAIFDFIDGRNFTISGWFNRETFTTDDTIVAKKNDQLNSSAGYVVWIDDSTDDIRLVVSDGDSTNHHTVDSTSTFTATGWNHFVIVYDDSGESNSKIYINGRDDNATNTTSGTFADIGSLANAVDFRIGSESDGGEPFAGELDDVQIFNYALNSTQVRTLYNQGAVFFGPAEGYP